MNMASNSVPLPQGNTYEICRSRLRGWKFSLGFSDADTLGHSGVFQGEVPDAVSAGSEHGAAEERTQGQGRRAEGTDTGGVRWSAGEDDGNDDDDGDEDVMATTTTTMMIMMVMMMKMIVMVMVVMMKMIVMVMMIMIVMMTRW